MREKNHVKAPKYPGFQHTFNLKQALKQMPVGKPSSPSRNDQGREHPAMAGRTDTRLPFQVAGKAMSPRDEMNNQSIEQDYGATTDSFDAAIGQLVYVDAPAPPWTPPQFSYGPTMDQNLPYRTNPESTPSLTDDLASRTMDSESIGPDWDPTPDEDSFLYSFMKNGDTPGSSANGELLESYLDNFLPPSEDVLQGMDAWDSIEAEKLSDGSSRNGI
jgi:hypothetical protein